MKKKVIIVITCMIFTKSVNSQDDYFLNVSKVLDDLSVELQFVYGENVLEISNESFRFWKIKADEGDDNAQFLVANCYYLGKGVIQNNSSAFSYWKMAANKNNQAAQLNLGICFYLGVGTDKNFESAVLFFNKALENRYSTLYILDEPKEVNEAKNNAKYLLGLCYLNGNGVIKHEVEAFNYFNKAENSKHIEAYWALGYCYEKGIGVIRNYEQALTYLKKAADGRSFRGMLDLGYWCEYGYHTEKDENKALYWYTKVLKQLSTSRAEYHNMSDKIMQLRGKNFSEEKAIYNTSYLESSTYIVGFNVSGGSKNIKVFTDGSIWDIREKPNWITVNKEDNILKISCAQNQGVFRSGFIRIVSNHLIKQIAVSQDSKLRGEILNLNVLHDQSFNRQRGMKLKVDFIVHDMFGVQGNCIVYLYDKHTGAPIIYTNTGKQITYETKFNPLTKDWKHQLEFFIPYNLRVGNYYLIVKLLDSNNQIITTSNIYYFVIHSRQ